MTEWPEMDGWVPPEVDFTKPSPSRVYDYWLGGRDNGREDRRVGDQVTKVAPWVPDGAKANRAFLKRAVTYLAERGVEQFIDLGSGLPTRENVHQVAAKVNSRARVAYVDNDPVVLTYARALLADRDHAIVVPGDIREPDSILCDTQLQTYLDLSQPVAVLFVAILHFVSHDENPARIVRAFHDAMAPGSYLVVSHVTDDVDEQRAKAIRVGAELYSETTAPFTVRSAGEIHRLFEGFDLVSPPGLVNVDHWMQTSLGIPIPVLAGVGQRSEQQLEPPDQSLAFGAD